MNRRAAALRNDYVTCQNAASRLLFVRIYVYMYVHSTARRERDFSFGSRCVSDAGSPALSRIYTRLISRFYRALRKFIALRFQRARVIGRVIKENQERSQEFHDFPAREI